MRLFIYEYTCASGLAESPLRTEGEAMLAALCADCARLPHVEPLTLRDTTDEEASFRAVVRAADATLVIAPECDDILRTRCRWVVEEGGRWLGSSADAIRLSGDKLLCAEHLRRAGVPSPVSLLVRAACPLTDHFPAVLKPRFGAGSQSTYLLRSSGNHGEQWTALIQRAYAEGWEDLILQLFVPGQAVSVAFLIGPRQRIALLPAEQHLSDDGRFHYLGGRLPLAPARAERARRLADRAVAAVPGLGGYVGVDLILGAGVDGGGDVVIEINPRLTTSYIGLRALAAGNLADLMLRVANGEAVAEPDWRSGCLDFRADGTIVRGR